MARSADASEMIVVSKVYDLIRWSCDHVGRFPRNRRFTLGDRLERRLYDILEALVRAKYTRERGSILRTVNLELEQLRFQFRLAHDLRCLSTTSYGHAAERVNEIGRLVGGWLKANPHDETIR